MILTRRRRVAVLFLLLIIASLVFVYRLVDVQVLRAFALNAEAEERRSTQQIVYGSRGQIVDRNGTVLADSVMRYDITVSPKNARDFNRVQADGSTVRVTRAQAAEEMGKLLGVSGAEVLAKIDAALAENNESDFAYIAKQVSVETYQAIEALEIPWQFADRHPSRMYPNGAVAGNLLGYMGDESKALAGVELTHDECLAATDGLESFLRSGKDFVALPGSTVVEKPASDGGTVKLTIDSELQWFAQRVALAQVNATGARWATVVVQEVKTGKLLAVVDVPTVDPNDPTATNSESRGSRAFTAPFEPGSTFKALTASIVLDAKAGSPGEGVTAPYRYLPANGANVNDSSRHGDLPLTLTGVLVESSNTGISQFGERLSEETRFNYMKAFGIGSKTEVNFLGEEPGILRDWRDWDNQTSYTTMFGQGVATTAIQIASVYQTLGNNGVRMPVSLVESCTDADGTVHDLSTGEGTRVISEQAADDTVTMLEQTYLKGWLASKWNIPGYRVATKTGTAQVPDGRGGYQRGFLVSVAGLAPADDPQYVVSVSIMDPVRQNSSAASAPVFQQIMSQVLKANRVVPSGSAAPDWPIKW